MHRYRMNRMWTLLLALALGVAGLSALSRVASAAPESGGWTSDDQSGPVDPPPSGSGDPDSPSNGGKPTTRATVSGGRVGVFASRGSGETASLQRSAWVYRVRVLVSAMKAYYLNW